MNTQNRPDTATAAADLAADYRLIPTAHLQPSPLNPRQHFDGVEELAENIARQGVLVPLLVRPYGGSSEWSFEIVDGERRYRAAKTAGVETLPAIVRDLHDDEVLEIQLLSAIQRQALTPLEEARGYRRLIDSNPAKYSAAYIADRISRSERYVVDRMRLLALIPALQQLLDAERIGVAHAELLAKLKPEDQERAAYPGETAGGYGRSGDPGGLWQRTGRTLEFDEDDEDPDSGADPYAGLKPRTVKELEAWIARHVRFDVQHFAETAPLEFGETAIRVEAAVAQPGRGKKVIQITTDYRPDDDVRKDGGERIYSQRSWKRADGTEGTSRGGRYGDKAVDSPTCLHSVLGVVVTGPGYGTAFPVCIARDKCEVHWKAEIEERQKRAKAATSTQGGATASKPAEESWEARQKRETEQRRLETAALAAVYPQIEAAILEALPPTPMTAGVFAFLWKNGPGGKPPAGTPDTYLTLLVREAVQSRKPTGTAQWGIDGDLKTLCEIAVDFGIDPKPYQAAYKQQLAQAKKAAAAPATTTPAKKAAKKTAKKKGGRS